MHLPEFDSRVIPESGFFVDPKICLPSNCLNNVCTTLEIEILGLLDCCLFDSNFQSSPLMSGTILAKLESWGDTPKRLQKLYAGTVLSSTNFHLYKHQTLNNLITRIL